MITRFEERVRYEGSLYQKTTWYFIGIPVLRRWEQLTSPYLYATPSELGR